MPQHGLKNTANELVTKKFQSSRTPSTDKEKLSHNSWSLLHTIDAHYPGKPTAEREAGRTTSVYPSEDYANDLYTKTIAKGANMPRMAGDGYLMVAVTEEPNFSCRLGKFGVLQRKKKKSLK
jgi:hypothetical protein